MVTVAWPWMPPALASLRRAAVPAMIDIEGVGKGGIAAGTPLGSVGINVARIESRASPGNKNAAPNASPKDGYTLEGKPNPVGQAIVKESWLPAEIDPHTGTEVRPSRKADMFIMYKVDPATPGTDRGWVYGTVTPDGKKVTSAGRVESCMRCHKDAPHDGLFGLPRN
jgi:hypothetical protein